MRTDRPRRQYLHIEGDSIALYPKMALNSQKKLFLTDFGTILVYIHVHDTESQLPYNIMID